MKNFTTKPMISAGDYHTVGLKSDGTAVAVGGNLYGECDIESWSNLVSISAGERYTIGLKSDGTAVAVGYNREGQCDIKSWRNLVSISAGKYHTVGLKSDGTAVAVGENGEGQCDIKSWSNLVSISVGSYHTVGLKSDGTAVAVGDNFYGECDIESWSNLVSISAGDSYTVGLKLDGTAVEVGSTTKINLASKGWDNLVSISAGADCLVGLKSDGTAVAVGGNLNGECDIKSWSNLVSISVGEYHTVGLKSDGTAVAVGNNVEDQCNVSDWYLGEPERNADLNNSVQNQKNEVESVGLLTTGEGYDLHQLSFKNLKSELEFIVELCQRNSNVKNIINKCLRDNSECFDYLEASIKRMAKEFGADGKQWVQYPENVFIKNYKEWTEYLDRFYGVAINHLLTEGMEYGDFSEMDSYIEMYNEFVREFRGVVESLRNEIVKENPLKKPSVKPWQNISGDDLPF